ncbi:SpoIIE family protein phosphatase [Streptomyces clavuligerus]|uniref:Magnesium or manganese-dependent protein phosphatase n=1 Tax=Streptomyces clavuligerus TaxID=1901 RepID=B5GTW5_STRCL|nr:SpoIIE family protein phosphatase [Streptomyces clavuligerus]ANW18337.1 PAS sensor protein [Streptomyces clavuligerus]AXU12894.1 PAS domain S-box protein [Streptomyces clavuligerus]EDY49761.1 magnesium or manganese-dependent protein phosphatase [Streptomyces clavuligerus]EFG09042.1 Magnesium or manganese-dependent protein phosphatase [Streptomyces clavuligerus]MBY6302816.1 SpoIIE family protein phosphatase [Streptomyces clavuligerus]
MSEITGTSGDVVWQSCPPGSIHDSIRVASFSLGPDGRIDRWSRRAAELFGITAAEARGRDLLTVLLPDGPGRQGGRTAADLLDGKEWTGLVPLRAAGNGGAPGMAEVLVVPSETETGERAALCIVTDVGALRGMETDLAASQAIFGQSPFGFLLFGTDLRVRRANQRVAAVFGGTAEEHRGRTVHDYLPRSEAERMDGSLRRVLESGEPVIDLQFVGTAPGGPERRHWSVNLYRVHDAAGRPIGVAGVGHDVTRRQVAAREAASARRNLALLNEASARIGNSLDLETTARELLDVAVPGFCDLASVDLYQSLLTGDEAPPGRWDAPRAESYGGSAALRRVAFASAVSDAPLITTPGCGSRGGTPTAVGEVHRYTVNSPCANALRTARVQAIPGQGGGSLVQSTLAVPMVAHDSVVGLVQFSRTKGSEPFGERDRALAVELAARAAVCIDNARLYRREHERALILQRSLLPPGDPEAAGLDIACRYLPGNAATEVGGDWFDVIELPGHRTALVVGDVMGRGLRAAVAMGELRTAVRTLALLDMEPAEVLSALDEVARGLGSPIGAQQASRVAHKSRDADLSEVYLATCVYAVYDPVTRRCTFANAGHLPPVLVEPGQEALLLDVPPGMPLGVGGEPFEEVEVELPEGALLALYTDGLVESRHHPLDEGLKAFRSALTGPSRPTGPAGPVRGRTAPEHPAPEPPALGPDLSRSLEDVCDHVLTSLDTRHGEDDIALLMARVRGLPAEAVGDWLLPREPRSVGRARELARALLVSWDLEPLVDTVELLVSELVTNALRYGEGEIRLRLLRDRTLVCEVWDSGLVQPRRRRARDTDEGGRGLQLVGLLSAAWGSRRTPRGKTVWFELALPDGNTPTEPTVDQLLSMF